MGLRSPKYTLHCIYTFMLLATAVLSAISFSRVHLVTLKGLRQRCYVNILSVVHIIWILLFFFINDWKFLKQTRPYKTISLTKTSFLWLISSTAIAKGKAPVPARSPKVLLDGDNIWMGDHLDSFLVDISHAVYLANTSIWAIFNQLIPEHSHATKRITAQSLKGGCMTADP